MRAFITLNEHANPISKPGPASGLILPYYTKFGIPVFTLDSGKPWIDGQQIDAVPGMIGISWHGDQIYCIDSNEDVQTLPVRIVTHPEYEQFLQFEKVRDGTAQENNINTTAAQADAASGT